MKEIDKKLIYIDELNFLFIFMYVRLLLVVWRQTVTLLIRNIVGSIPTAYTNFNAAIVYRQGNVLIVYVGRTLAFHAREPGSSPGEDANLERLLCLGRVSKESRL